jgi:hypothetical protein
VTAPLVFVDTETTALHHGRRAWEVAMIRTEPGQTVGRGLSFFVGDVDLANADPKSLQIGRFYNRHPLYNGTYEGDNVHSWVHPAPLERPGPKLLTESQAARVVEQWTRGAHLVGAVPSFDAEVLDGMLHRHKLSASWHYHLIDVEALAVGYLHGRFNGTTDVSGLGITPAETVTDQTFVDEPREVIAREFQVDLPWNSEQLSRLVGVEPAPASERHTAMGDARWAQRIYTAVTLGRAVTP